MLGKEWTREFLDEYVIWLEHTLFKILVENGEKELQENNIEVADISASQVTINDSNEIHNDKESNNQEIITFIRNKLNSLESVSKNEMIANEDQFIEYFLQSNNNRRYPEMAFLFDINYIDDANMNDFYFALLKEDGRIIIDQNDKIKGLKLLLSEFLYQCGYDDALKFQEDLLIKNIEKSKNNSSGIMSDKKIFENVKIEYKNGTSENVTIFYGKIRGKTAWYIKTQNKIYRKITKNKCCEYICGEGKSRVVIKDKDIVEYISKDYN